MVLRFEDLIVWQKAQDLACGIYKFFGSLKDYSFKDQICRASVSTSSNIAEGFDQRSTKEYLRFLQISRTSANEVKSLLYLSSRLQFISIDKQQILLEKTEEIIKMTVGLIKSLQSKL
jgi:four helix bundle protein